MARRCIICGEPAGSREHVFPAALGGRRTNKGIYCGLHNGGFSPLAAVLAAQLRPINAMLGVRPDHSNNPTSFKFENNSDGETYVLDADSVSLADPKILKESPVDAETAISMRFSSQAQADAWIAQQRALGKKVNINSREERFHYFAEPLNFQLQLGGPEGLRAIGYVALTFFAHHFSDKAQKPKMAAFKNFLLGAAHDDFVAWDNPDTLVNLANSRFAFSHVVVLGTSASLGKAFAFVSLFSALTFAVDLGEVEEAEDQTVIVYIDPQADHPPDDIVEMRLDVLIPELSRCEPKNADLHHFIMSGQAQNQTQKLLQKIADWHLTRIAGSLFNALSLISIDNFIECSRQVLILLGPHGQLVFNLLKHFINGFVPLLENDPRMTNAVIYLKTLAAPDTASSTGLSEAANEALESAKAKLSEEIAARLKSKNLDLATLSGLLGGGAGVSVVGRSVIERMGPPPN